MSMFTIRKLHDVHTVRLEIKSLRDIQIKGYRRGKLHLAAYLPFSCCRFHVGKRSHFILVLKASRNIYFCGMVCIDDPWKCFCSQRLMESSRFEKHSMWLYVQYK